MKRFSRLMLALAVLAKRDTDPETALSSVIGGTGWGSLSETWDFLTRLFAGNEKSSSPIDFVGSVHNAALGQVAMALQARGANITTTGGDVSFEQALWTAGLLGEEEKDAVMVMGGDEHHPDLTVRFDMSAGPGVTPADGGGALVLQPGSVPGRPTLIPRIFKKNTSNLDSRKLLETHFGNLADFTTRYGAIMAGVPLANSSAQARFDALKNAYSPFIPVLDYRRFTGQFATASAVACVLAADAVARGQVPDPDSPGQCIDLGGRGLLLLGLGRYLTAIEVMPG